MINEEVINTAFRLSKIPLMQLKQHTLNHDKSVIGIVMEAWIEYLNKHQGKRN